MKEKIGFYTQEETGIRYPEGDLFGYPDSLIRARTKFAYEFGVKNLSGDYQRVMDYGSGRGHGVKVIGDYLKPKTIVSVDRYAPYLELQKKFFSNEENTIQHEFVNCSTPPLPFANESFDAIFFMHVIEHIKEPISLLKDMFRILRPGGEVVIATPNKKNIVGKNPTDEHVYTEDELPSMLYFSGFQPEQFFVVPNDRALKVHERKKWLATHLPITGNIRNKVAPDIWDKMVLRSGLSNRPLETSDFSINDKSDKKAIDLLVIAKKLAI